MWATSYDKDVTVAAPGLKLTTTALNLNSPTPKYDCNFGGTSGSAPQVSGIAALMLSVDRTLSAAEVKRRIAKYADPITDGETDSLLPLGRINACRALLLLDCD